MVELMITGHLGSDATIVQSQKDNGIKFSVASTKTYTDANNVKHTKTSWVKCVYWRNNQQSTKIVEYLKTGIKVLVRGEPFVSPYLDRENKPSASLEIRVTYIELMSKNDGATIQTQNQNESTNTNMSNNVSSDDDLPF